MPAASWKALIVTAPEPLRDTLRGRPWRQQLGACSELVSAPGDPVEHRATVRALALTAQRALAARQDAKQLETELRQLVTVMAPALLAQPGIGPSARPSCWSAGPIPTGSVPRPPWPCWLARPRRRRPLARWSVIA
jgi:hypothetical protein